MTGIKVVGTGRFLPAKIFYNDDFDKKLDTSDEWISSRTGIKSRYFVTDETNWQMAAKAAARAMEAAKVNPEQIGAIICATFTPDYSTPAVACVVQRELGLRGDIPAFDINAACSGFVYGLKVAQSMMIEMKEEYVLLIGSEVVSRMMDFNDRSTCVLFGDGAGAVVLKKDPSKAFYSKLGAEGNPEALSCLGANFPNAYIKMDGTKVFKFAVDAGAKAINEILRQSGLSIDDIDYFVCHQANKRIIDFIGKIEKIPKEKLYLNLDRYANTVAATIPIALDELVENKQIKEGSKVMVLGFGSGLTWGGALLYF